MPHGFSMLVRNALPGTIFLVLCLSLTLAVRTATSVDDTLSAETSRNTLQRLVLSSGSSLGLGFMSIVDALIKLGGKTSCLASLESVKAARPSGLTAAGRVSGDKFQRVQGVSRVIAIMQALAM